MLGSFGLKSYLWFQIELMLRPRSILKSCMWLQPILHFTWFNYYYKSLLNQSRLHKLFWRTDILSEAVKANNDQERWLHLHHFNFIWKAWEARVESKHVWKMHICYLHMHAWYGEKLIVLSCSPLYWLILDYIQHLSFVVIN